MVKRAEVAEIVVHNHAREILGIELAAAAAGIKYAGRTDTALIRARQGSTLAGVFTRNAFCAAPVVVAREHIACGQASHLIVNAGNANAGTGAQGLADVRAVCTAIAGQVAVEPEQVLPFSTGVIGERLPVEKILNVIPDLVESLAPGNWDAAAAAMMTTDTVSKCYSTAIEVEGANYTVTGIVKGAGMIKPNMATMLAFIATDAGIEPELLQSTLSAIASRTFNRITVDGDTSTNDACILIATGAANPSARIAHRDHPHWNALCTAIEAICAALARAIIADAEGATKCVTLCVSGAATEADCLQVGFTIAESPLVKTALFAADPNWGRILAAIGRAEIEALEIARASIAINDLLIVEHGEAIPGFDEQRAAAIMKNPTYEINVKLGDAATTASVLTCDFSYDYVRINAEYRS